MDGASAGVGVGLGLDLRLSQEVMSTTCMLAARTAFRAEPATDVMTLAGRPSNTATVVVWPFVVTSLAPASGSAGFATVLEDSC